ncbi:16S rRNA (cytosine(1402)-N(4))-methyltransferase RsmH [Acetobacter senegalensis]|uniref:16S rRNA (cytosine(1402)-N(4))-methyltransferase RsmH n=1 Tax=Acetobacter senegalensis TaxID=446692 RepID=UPI001EDA3762|nr:16S rRNA (cytosine(1402)-N(4))-methyltransferase RsmH [Acetobacter senegalensis]MCG4252484.1 16S rRNA (cytosine(1402)-N(4))-methyltransferase RsmH [Acetobacter senegalensis]
MNALPLSLPTSVSSGHIPVMLTEVLEALKPADGNAILDCTFGGGGYTTAILNAADCTVWAIDRDPDAIVRGNILAKAFAEASGKPRLHMLHGSFGTMRDLTQQAEAPAFDGIVLDLGVSSFQLDEAERGFSFKQDGPLDMRMARSGRTAADVVNTASEAELADIFHFYGEERHARRVARAIVADRVETPFTTTAQLAGLIRRVVPSDRSGIDSATRSFQGLRIAVNDELGEIERGLEQALDLLAPGGRLVVVSFHSLEDRIAKRVLGNATGKSQSFSRYDPRAAMTKADDAPFVALTGKPVRPGDAECSANPRARSARLRAVAKRPTDVSFSGKGLNP